MARRNSRRYSATMPRGYGLHNFMNFLVKAAEEAADDPRLTDEERARSKHGGILSRAITELKHLIDRQPLHARKHYWDSLWQALGSTGLVLSYGVEKPLEARKLQQAVTRAVEGTRKRSRTIEETIAAEAGPILQQYQHWKTGRLADDFFVDRVNKKLGGHGLRPLKRDTIVRHVDKFRMNARLSD